MLKRAWFLGLLSMLVSGSVVADEQSEKAAADLLRKKLAHEAPADAQVLQAMSDKDIVVVQGSRDPLRADPPNP